MPRSKLRGRLILASALATSVFGGIPTPAPGQTPTSPPAKDAAARDKVLYAWWADLEGDEQPATRALLNFADRPDETVAFLARKMKPLKIDAEKVKALVDWLGSDEPAIWKPAFEELEYFDPRLAIDLETLMADVTETPARQRMVEVMSGRAAGSLKNDEVRIWAVGGGDGFNFSSTIGSWWAEHKVSRINVGFGNTKKKWTRAVRAVVLLEHIKTPDAVALLKEMATGHPEAQPTRAAVEALKRIEGKAKPAETSSQP